MIRVERDGEWYEVWVAPPHVMRRSADGVEIVYEGRDLREVYDSKTEPFVRAGWTTSVRRFDEAREPALEAAALFDAEAARVYADWLQQRGEPRGELMAVQLAIESGKTVRLVSAERALLHDHAERLLGPIAPWLVAAFPADDDGLAVTWRRGFIDDASLGYRCSAGALAALLAHPSGRQLRALSIGRLALRSRVAGGRAIFETLLRASPAPPLRSLGMPWSVDDHVEPLGNLDRLDEIYPDLEELTLDGRAELRTLALPRARRLSLRSGAMTRTTLAAITSADWPALVALELAIGIPARGFGAEVDDVDALAPVLAGDRFPALRVLRLADMAFGDALCARLVASPLAARLEVLVLGGDHLSDAGAETLAANAARFTRLRELRIEDSWVHAVGRAALRKAGLPVVVTP